ncbi:Alpha/Beta hydrolase protein [Phyllosticta citrichinensis]|uniref:Alpha/Beta hydrolase protein n=1 Tax=Phyllosticta citrichinensis TaxID=1130410 RepID=A0ABR1XFJ6_9PEZI
MAVAVAIPPLALASSVGRVLSLSGRASQVRGVHSVTVPCRSNGAIRLSILPSPSASASASASAPAPAPAPASSPILLYLPAGPLLADHARPDHDAQTVAALSAASGATVVCINYRLAEAHRFPTPVHDVLTAWDWVLHNLVESDNSARLGVCGELLGANLATTLALTECHDHGPAIAAAAVNNPLVDWILPPDLLRSDDDDDDDGNNDESDDGFLEQLQDIAGVSLAPGRRRRKQHRRPSWDAHGDNPALPAAAVTRARAAFFHDQDGYFDPFASPIHFLRTPGLAFTALPKSDDAFASDWDEEPPTQPPSTASPYHGLRATVEPRRRSYRAYPPTAAGLRLPVMSVSAGEASPLRDQAEELVRLVQHSVKLDSGGSRDEALNRCALMLRPGVGHWTGAHRAPDWRREVEALGAWFREVLAKDDDKQLKQ